MIEIDGGERSGSGTIVRLAVSLCTVLGEDLRLINIRAKRDKRGLRPQHQQVVTACADMCGGEVERAEVGSSEMVYRPGQRIKGGAYEWDIGTAGSTTMLAMSLLLVGSFADKPSAFTLKGGLFQDFAPSAHYMRGVLLPLLRRMGVDAELLVKKPGYVPEGKGVLEIKAQPAKAGLRPLILTDQGKVTGVRGIALSSHLAEQEVSDRMAEECSARLEEAGVRCRNRRRVRDISQPEGGRLERVGGDRQRRHHWSRQGGQAGKAFRGDWAICGREHTG